MFPIRSRLFYLLFFAWRDTVSFWKIQGQINAECSPFDPAYFISFFFCVSKALNLLLNVGDFPILPSLGAYMHASVNDPSSPTSSLWFIVYPARQYRDISFILYTTTKILNPTHICTLPGGGGPYREKRTFPRSWLQPETISLDVCIAQHQSGPCPVCISNQIIEIKIPDHWYSSETIISLISLGFILSRVRSIRSISGFVWCNPARGIVD